MSLIGQAVSGKKMFENYGHIHVICPRAGADNTMGSIFSFTHLFSQFSPLLQVFPIQTYMLPNFTLR